MSFRILVIMFLFSFYSCPLQEKNDRYIVSSQFENILSDNNVDGVILIFDEQKQIFYSNDFREASEAVLPASTFKIPHTIIGLEIGLLKDKHTVFEWNGAQRALPVWKKDLTVKEAFQLSCVPCYQELARQIGADRMNTHLTKIEFGDMHVNTQNIDNFWLIS